MLDSNVVEKWIDVLQMNRWAKTLGCSEVEVNASIRRVGNSVAAVRTDLAKHAAKQKQKAKLHGATLLAEHEALPKVDQDKVRVHMLGF